MNSTREMAKLLIHRPQGSKCHRFRYTSSSTRGGKTARKCLFPRARGLNSCPTSKSAHFPSHKLILAPASMK